MFVEENGGKEPDLFLFNNIIEEDTDVEELECLDDRFSDVYELQTYRETDNAEEKFNILFKFICENEELFDFDISELEYYDEFEKYDFVEEYEHLILHEIELNAEHQDYKNYNNYLEYENVIIKNIVEKDDCQIEQEEEWD